MKLPSYVRNLLLRLMVFAAGVNGVSAYQLALFPARTSHNTDIRTLHRNLQLSEAALVVGDFEDEELAGGLSATVSGAFDGSNGQSLTNPNAWDGNLTSSAQNSPRFSFSRDGIRLFGIGIGDNDFGGNEEFSSTGSRLFSSINCRATNPMGKDPRIS